MKIFGGGGSRRDKSANSKPTAKKANKPNQQTSDISYVPHQMKNAKSMKNTKIAKKQKKPRSIVTKILIFIAILIALTIVAGGVWLAMNVRKPDISQPHQNDTTVNDPENGDNPIINLNQGERIDDFFTFAVCATDIDGTRTDNIMVVAFDANKHTVNIMNVPRDTMSNVNRTGANKKINAAYAKGIEQTKKQIAQVMGFTPDKYIVVDFNGIAEIVDAIGGVDYEIPFPMMYSDPVQDLEINFPTPGVQHLDGEQVVEFLRWRKNGPGFTSVVPEEYLNGDETRIAKQQEFLIYLAKKVLTPANAFKFKDIADAVFNNVKTDLTAGEMIWLAGQAFQIDTANGINMFTLPGYSAMSTAGTNTEYSFYFVNESEALSIINQYFNPYAQPIKYLDLVSGPTKSSSSSKKDYDDDEDYDDEDDDYTPPRDDEDDEDDEQSSPSKDDESNSDNKNDSNSDNNSDNNNSSDNNSDKDNNSSDNGSENGTSEPSENPDEGSSNSGNSSDNNSGSENNNSSNSGGSTSSPNEGTSVDPEA